MKKNKLHKVVEDMPKVGEDIYVPTSLYIDHGEDDVQGGRAEVVNVDVDNYGNIMVSVKELPGRAFGWSYLKTLQDKLKEQYGDNRAFPDPDFG